MSLDTIARVRRAFVEEGLATALHRRPDRTPRLRKLDGRAEAHLVALACSTPPAGAAHWTMQLLTERFVPPQAGQPPGPPQADGAPNLKANVLKPWLIKHWCIPPRHSAAFVEPMEDILDVYERPYDERFPVVGMDETSTQLIGETRPPQAGPLPRASRRGSITSTNPPQADGVVRLRRMWVEPLAGRRHVQVTARRTKTDWAHFIRDLVDVHSPAAERVVLVLDNLNTHVGSALYETFPAAEARPA